MISIKMPTTAASKSEIVEQYIIKPHWMWAAIERINAGEEEQAVLADYGYVKKTVP